MKSKFLWLFLCCVMAMTLVAWSCGGTQPSEQEEEEEEEPQYGGTLSVLGVYAHRYPPTAWDHGELVWTTGVWTNPYQESLLTGDFLSKGPRGTNEYAFQINVGVPDSVVTGQLAESWEMPDDKTIIFNIRQGVMWQSKPGVMEARELTASDVAYCFNRLLDSGIYSLLNDNIESVTVPDKYTVVFKMKNFLANWRRTLGYHQNMFIYPPELVEAGADDWRNAVGTGPFMLDDFVEGSSITYVRNPNYWDTATINGEEYEIPFIDTLVQLLITDESTRIAALRTGQCDIEELVDFKYTQTLANNNPEIVQVKILSDTTKLVGMRMDTEPFDDIAVRKALSMAIDRQALINTVFGGEAEILSFPYTMTWPLTLYTPVEDLPESVQEQFEYDAVRARELLDEAGVPTGFQTELVISAEDQDLAALLVSFWDAVGVECALKQYDSSTWLSISRSKGHEQMILTRKAIGDPFEPIYVTAVDPEGTYNASIVNDPTLNQMYNEAISTVDLTEQQRLCKDMVNYYVAQNYFIILPTPYNYLYYWPWVKNYYGETCVGAASRTGPVFARVWIDSALKAELLGQ